MSTALVGPARTRRVTLAGLAAGLFAWVLVGVLAAVPAQAHAQLLEIDPPDGTVLESAPSAITFTFSEPVRVADDAVTLIAADGDPVPAEASASDTVVTVTPGAELGQGTFVLSWRVVSADGHPIAGATTFSVGEESATTAAAATGVEGPTAVASAARVVVQAVAYLGILLWAGLAIFEVLVRHRPAAHRGPLSARRIRLSAQAGVVALVAAVLLLPLTAIYQDAGRLLDLVDPGTWTSQVFAAPGIATLVLLPCVIVATSMLRAPLWDTAARGVVVAAAVLGLSSLAVVGHTRSYGPAWVVIGSDVLHVVVAATWLGGLVALGMMLHATAVGVRRASEPATGVLAGARTGPGSTRPASGTDTLGAGDQETGDVADDLSDVDVEDTARTLVRFSTLAAGLVAVLAVTGTLLGLRIIGSVDALTGTGYGRTLLVKVGVAALIVALAGWNRFRLVPRVLAGRGDPERWARLRRAVGVESVLLVVVVGLTGLLVGQSPADGHDGEHGAAGGSGEHAGGHGEDTFGPEQVGFGDGSLTVAVNPVRVGPTTVEFRIADPDGSGADPLELPEATLTQPEAAVGPLTAEVEQIAPGLWSAAVDLPVAGPWELQVSARLTEFEKPVATMPFEVG